MNDGSFNKNLDQIDPSLTYTQILKEISRAIKFDTEYIKDFIGFGLDAFTENECESMDVNKPTRR